MNPLAVSLAVIGTVLLVSAVWQVADLYRIRRHNQKARKHR